MRLIVLTTVALSAFAANSIFNRLAIVGGDAGPLDFAGLRTLSGAAALYLLHTARRRAGGAGASAGGVGATWGAAAAAGLALYMVAFSMAYLALDAGTGALILFGAVQVTMFAGAWAGGDTIPARRWWGAGLALAGLLVLTAPGQAVAPWAALTMAVAGLGFGVFSLAGRRAVDPLAATGRAFALSAPLVLVAWAIGGSGLTAVGAGLAVVSGALTSGVGYAVWYSALPGLGASRAGVAQLTVPLLAAAAGVVLLDESLDWRFAVAAALILGGVAAASMRRAPMA